MVQNWDDCEAGKSIRKAEEAMCQKGLKECENDIDAQSVQVLDVFTCKKMQKTIMV